jgi:hypothetical protein
VLIVACFGGGHTQPIAFPPPSRELQQVKGLGFRIYNLGLRVKGEGVRVKVNGEGLKALGLGFRV